MKKPILHSLMAWVFPRATAWMRSRRDGYGYRRYKAGYQQGYASAKQDIARSMMANISTWYSCSVHTDDNGYGWYDVTIQKPEDADD